jgi:hypothetical protein
MSSGFINVILIFDKLNFQLFFKVRNVSSKFSKFTNHILLLFLKRCNILSKVKDTAERERPQRKIKYSASVSLLKNNTKIQHSFYITVTVFSTSMIK